MSQSIRSKKGFTLVELVVVIAILAILAAIAIPAVMNVIDKANESSDLSNAKVMESALKTGAALTNPTSVIDTNNDEFVDAGEAKTYLQSADVDIKVEAPKRGAYSFYVNGKTLKVDCVKTTDGAGLGADWNVLVPDATPAG